MDPIESTTKIRNTITLNKNPLFTEFNNLVTKFIENFKKNRDKIKILLTGTKGLNGRLQGVINYITKNKERIKQLEHDIEEEEENGTINYNRIGQLEIELEGYKENIRDLSPVIKEFNDFFDTLNNNEGDGQETEALLQQLTDLIGNEGSSSSGDEGSSPSVMGGLSSNMGDDNNSSATQSPKSSVINLFGKKPSTSSNPSPVKNPSMFGKRVVPPSNESQIGSNQGMSQSKQLSVQPEINVEEGLGSSDVIDEDEELPNYMPLPPPSASGVASGRPPMPNRPTQRQKESIVNNNNNNSSSAVNASSVLNAALQPFTIDFQLKCDNCERYNGTYKYTTVAGGIFSSNKEFYQKDDGNYSIRFNKNTFGNAGVWQLIDKNQKVVGTSLKVNNDNILNATGWLNVLLSNQGGKALPATITVVQGQNPSKTDLSLPLYYPDVSGDDTDVSLPLDYPNVSGNDTAYGIYGGKLKRRTKKMLKYKKMNMKQKSAKINKLVNKIIKKIYVQNGGYLASPNTNTTNTTNTNSNTMNSNSNTMNSNTNTMNTKKNKNRNKNRNRASGLKRKSKKNMKKKNKNKK
jgi:hypothetical protein